MSRIRPFQGTNPLGVISKKGGPPYQVPQTPRTISLHSKVCKEGQKSGPHV